jgi:peptide/nickel transport system substrate-binding protein
LAGCAQPGSPQEESLSLTIGSDVDRLAGQYDPRTAASYAFDIRGAYDTLFNLGTDFEVIPNLGTAYEVSDDRKSMTITLRDDVQFVDGTPLDAEAVVEFLTRASTDQGSGYVYFTEQYGAGYEVVDATTILVTTTSPITYSNFFDDLMLALPIGNPAALDDPSLATTPNGTGAYTVVENVPGVSVTLERRSEYWNDEAYPYQTVEVLAFEDDVAKLNALKSGQIDAARLGLSLAEEAVGAGFHLDQGSETSVVLWIADRGGSIVPALGDLRVRQAMAYAFDRATINSSLNYGFGKVSSQPFAAGSVEYVDGADDMYAFDLERAKDLMADAGYADGFDLTIPLISGNGGPWAPIIQEYLGDIGIRVEFDEDVDGSKTFGGTSPVVLWNGKASRMVPNYLARAATFPSLPYADPEREALIADLESGTQEQADDAVDALGEYSMEEAWFVVVSTVSTTWLSDGVRHDVDQDFLWTFSPLTE